MLPKLRLPLLAASALAAFSAAATLSAAVLFHDDFESGDLSKWSQVNSYFITDDPFQTGDHAFSTPGGASRTSLARATGAITAYTGGLNFPYQVYSGDAQANWQAKAVFGNGGGVNAPGYGCANTVTLVSQSLGTPPLLAGQWNTISFEWLQDGTLTFKIRAFQIEL